MADILVRPERPEDQRGIHDLHVATFGSDIEANLVDALRVAGASRISLVAVDSETIVGHVLLSAAELVPHADVSVAALAPMAVAPAMQRRGIGTALGNAALSQCAASGIDAVVLVGYPEFYGRFGFRPASILGLKCAFDVPPEVFMALEIQPNALGARSGLIRYHPAFPKA